MSLLWPSPWPVATERVRRLYQQPISWAAGLEKFLHFPGSASQVRQRTLLGPRPGPYMELLWETCLLDGNLIAFEKPSGGVRPSAVCKILYRFAGIYRLRACGWDIEASLAPLQVMDVTKGGSETSVHTLATALIEGLAIFMLDSKVAFTMQQVLENAEARAAVALLVAYLHDVIIAGLADVAAATVQVKLAGMPDAIQP